MCSSKLVSSAAPDMKAAKPIACLSLDVDNLWSYLKIYGDPHWKNYPSYLDRFIPFVLGILADLNLKITFFVVGLDAAQDENRQVLRQICHDGHEVGNHSYHHESWLQRYSKEELADEILQADAEIRDVTGQQPLGFRGPGFSWSAALMEVLSANRYRYDASILPTFIGPLARAYYFRTSTLSGTEKDRRKELFGKFSHGFLPAKPFQWCFSSADKLLEIPVTTIPWIKTPFHLSYLIYLGRISKILMLAYLQAAITLCRICKTSPSFLLHPLDLMGGDQVPELSFFPGMDLDGSRKLQLVHLIFAKLTRYFEFFPMGIYAEKMNAKQSLPVKNLR
jgi:peptidoglycan/xylan/chitin deacetylase (PgdA/CDA1 family)